MALPTFTIALAIAGSSWAGEFSLSPAIELTFKGARAPAGLAHIPARKTATLHVVGPAHLTLHFFGLRDKRGKKMVGPGAVAVRIDRNKVKMHILSKKRMTRWTVARHPRWIPTAGRKLTLLISNGKHTVKISPTSAAPVGVAFIAELTGGGAPRHAGASELDEPPLPGGMLGSPPGGDESLEPDLFTSIGYGSGDDEPDLMFAPGGTDSESVTQRLTVVGTPPPTLILVSPIGSERFLNVSIAGALHLGVIGPGVLLFEIHAHRDPSRPDSLKPVIVGLLLDEILVQTVSIEQAASPEYRVTGASFYAVVARHRSRADRCRQTPRSFDALGYRGPRGIGAPAVREPHQRR